MLAMDVNDIAGILNARGALGFFASMLAPTGWRPDTHHPKPTNPC